MDLLTLYAKLVMDSSDYEKGLDDAEKQAGSAGKTMKTAITAGAAAAGAAMTSFAVSSVKKGAEFEVAVSQIAATLGKTTEEVQDLREKALEMGASTNYTATQAAEGLNILAMSGYDAQQSMAMIEDVLHLAAAGSMDMASAAGYVSGAMKGFQDETKGSAYYADLMAKGATLANTNVQQLGEAMSGGAAVAASYGQSAESMTLSLLRLAEQGEVGSGAATALNAAMRNLYAPTDQAAKALGELGVSAFTSSGEYRDFNEVVNELNGALNEVGEDGLPKYTDAQKVAMAQTIFGIQGFNAYNKMVVTGVDQQEKWANALAHASDAGGEAAKQYATMTDNLKGKIDIMKSAIEGLQIRLSEKLIPVVSKVVEWITHFIETIDQSLPVIAFVVTGLMTLAAALNFVETLTALKTAFTGLFTLLSANPIALVITAIVSLAAYLVTLYNTSEEFRNKVNAIIDSLKEKFSAFIDFVNNMWTTITNAFTTGVQTVSAVIDAFKAFITNGMEAARNVVSTAMEVIRSTISSKIEAAKTTVNTVMDAIKKAFSDKIEAARKAVSDGIEKIKNLFKFEWSLPPIKLPHFSVSGGEAPWGFGGQGSLPSISVAWYKKAYDDILKFDRPTVLATPSGLKGFGDGNGSEYVMGEGKLKELLAESSTGDVTQIINIYSPTQLDPSEIARQTRNANRELSLTLRGV